jgi:hypothetical protein
LSSYKARNFSASREEQRFREYKALTAISTAMFMQFKVANTYIDNELFPDDPSFTPVDPDPDGEGIYVTLDQ